jgi:hypothetical protein
MTRRSKGGDGFLDRWSRRKLSAEEEQAAAEPEAPETAHEPDRDAITPEELAALPAPEDITEHTDITPFLKRGVPAVLKNAALRRIWMLTPAIRDHRDLAVDYAWDWNTPGGVPGSTGEVAAKGVADLIERLSSGRRKSDEDDDLEDDDKAAPAAERAREPRPASTEVHPAKTPDDTRQAEDKGTQSDRERPSPRHGGARPA